MPHESLFDIAILSGIAVCFASLIAALAWGVSQTKDLQLISAVSLPAEGAMLSPDNVIALEVARRTTAAANSPVTGRGTPVDDAA